MGDGVYTIQGYSRHAGRSRMTSEGCSLPLTTRAALTILLALLAFRQLVVQFVGIEHVNHGVAFAAREEGNIKALHHFANLFNCQAHVFRVFAVAGVFRGHKLHLSAFGDKNSAPRVPICFQYVRNNIDLSL